MFLCLITVRIKLSLFVIFFVKILFVVMLIIN